MKPTQDFFDHADKHIRKVLLELRPTLLKGFGSIEHHLKDDQSVVTEMDIMVEERLRAAMAEVDPSIGFGGEETGLDPNLATFWLVDPIDGTEAFTRGLPFSTNMICLIADHQPVMSVIYNFFTDDYFLAIKGRGASCNGHVIHVSERPLERAYVVATGRWHQSRVPNFVSELRPKVAGLPKLHGSGCENTYIAQGAFDGTIVAGGKGPWDHVPGMLLIQEAGGRVENWGSNTYDYRDMHIVAGNPVLFDDLKALTVPLHQQ
ncbi:MAG TPA: inositol monophosphatase [Candidatus Saccharimonadales bacterium]